MSTIEVNDYVALTGREVGVSRWFEIDQSRIADLTEDRQLIHVDLNAAANTPFGGTVAHGFLTLSILPAMAFDATPTFDGGVMTVNYGPDKIRFVAPVRSGSRVRARFKLIGITPRGPKPLMRKSEVTVEIDGSSKPALIADWLEIVFFTDPVPQHGLSL
jgi:acyl dehydratase